MQCFGSIYFLGNVRTIMDEQLQEVDIMQFEFEIEVNTKREKRRENKDEQKDYDSAM